MVLEGELTEAGIEVQRPQSPFYLLKKHREQQQQQEEEVVVVRS